MAEASLKSLLRVDRVEASEVPEVFNVKLIGLEEAVKAISIELPRQVQVFKEGMVVEAEASMSSIPWGGEADLYLSTRIFAVKREGDESTIYLSAGGLQVRIIVAKGVELRAKPMDRVYVAFRAREGG